MSFLCRDARITVKVVIIPRPTLLPTAMWKVLITFLKQYRQNPLLSGITFSGGEPFCQPEPLAALGRMVRATGGHVMTYTGYVYEDLLKMAKKDPAIEKLLAVTNVLVDGPYVEELRDLTLEFRGSSNQRLITLDPPANAQQ